MPLVAQLYAAGATGDSLPRPRGAAVAAVRAIVDAMQARLRTPDETFHAQLEAVAGWSQDTDGRAGDAIFGSLFELAAFVADLLRGRGGAVSRRRALDALACAAGFDSTSTVHLVSQNTPSQRADAIAERRVRTDSQGRLEAVEDQLQGGVEKLREALEILQAAAPAVRVRTLSDRVAELASAARSVERQVRDRPATFLAIRDTCELALVAAGAGVLRAPPDEAHPALRRLAQVGDPRVTARLASVLVGAVGVIGQATNAVVASITACSPHMQLDENCVTLYKALVTADAAAAATNPGPFRCATDRLLRFLAGAQWRETMRDHAMPLLAALLGTAPSLSVFVTDAKGKAKFGVDIVAQLFADSEFVRALNHKGEPVRNQLSVALVSPASAPSELPANAPEVAAWCLSLFTAPDELQRIMRWSSFPNPIVNDAVLAAAVARQQPAPTLHFVSSVRGFDADTPAGQRLLAVVARAFTSDAHAAMHQLRSLDMSLYHEQTCAIVLALRDKHFAQQQLPSRNAWPVILRVLVSLCDHSSTQFDAYWPTLQQFVELHPAMAGLDEESVRNRPRFATPGQQLLLYNPVRRELRDYLPSALALLCASRNRGLRARRGLPRIPPELFEVVYGLLAEPVYRAHGQTPPAWLQ